MATLTAYASSFDNNIPTGFANQLTNPANAQGAPDGTNFATDAVAGLHTGGNHYFFSSLATIPTGSIINSVTVSVNHAISTTTRGVYGYRLDSSPNNQIANEWVPTSANAIGTPQTNSTWSSTPSLAQLKASTFAVRARYQRTATQAVTYSLDAIAVIVDYTLPAYDVRVSFPTPTSAPGTGAGLQEFRALVRKKVNDANNPLARLELWESGALKSTVLADTAVTSTTGQVVSGSWDASTLTTASGANVECKVVGTNVGGNALEVGAIEWNKYPTDAVSQDTFLPQPNRVRQMLMRR